MSHEPYLVRILDVMVRSGGRGQRNGVKFIAPSFALFSFLAWHLFALFCTDCVPILRVLWLAEFCPTGGKSSVFYDIEACFSFGKVGNVSHKYPGGSSQI